MADENFKRKTNVWAVLAMILLGPACSGDRATGPDGALSNPCAFALAPHSGEEPIDAEIRQLQGRVRESGDAQALENLGWQFVSKARLTFDSGFYKLAEQCALCLGSKDSARLPAALLLRGHALHNLHRFKEAEELARKLVAERGLSFDYGLLGDSLLDQGKVRQAAQAYQKMADLRPGMRAYSRAAQVRWLKGDLAGAVQLMRMAARSGSLRTPEPTAWAYSRLALYELQAGAPEDALRSVELALQTVPEYAPALLARGRILLASGKAVQAADALNRAAQLNPLPEYAWALSEALRAAGREGQAREAESLLAEKGPADDRRTYSLYLSTRGQDAEMALRLARQEMETRRDIFTFDALAWALQAAGRLDEARSAMRSALAEGAQEARIFLHAGVIEARAGAPQEAARYLGRALAMRQMLLPSEQALLTDFIDRLGQSGSLSDD